MRLNVYIPVQDCLWYKLIYDAILFSKHLKCNKTIFDTIFVMSNLYYLFSNLVIYSVGQFA